jgi:hypothetical protein
MALSLHQSQAFCGLLRKIPLTPRIVAGQAGSPGVHQGLSWSHFFQDQDWCRLSTVVMTEAGVMVAVVPCNSWSVPNSWSIQSTRGCHGTVWSIAREGAACLTVPHSRLESPGEGLSTDSCSGFVQSQKTTL